MAYSLTDVQDKNSSLTSDNIFATSEYISTRQSPSQLWSGVLTIGISHGNGFSIPDQYQQALSSIQSDSSLTQAGKSKRPWLSRNRRLLPYAIVEYDKSHVYAHSYAAPGTIENPQWARLGSHSLKFDVFRAAELVLWFYLEHPSDHKGSCDFFLGKARIEPVLEENKYAQRLKVEEGTGEICVEIEYTKNTSPEIQAPDRKYGAYLGKSCSSDYYHIYQTEKKHTSSLYAGKILAKADSSSHGFLSQADKSFIAPLKFVAPIPEGLQLHSAFINGGPLFYHLQKPRCFDVDRSRFYAAEILCAFESLLQSNPSYRGPKTENILLDSIGHIVLCDFSLYNPDIEKTAHSIVEYPAPELLLDQNHSTGTSVHWWWTLGVFLYEMLTGMPPFYAESIEERHEKITSSVSIIYPNSLPLFAKEILIRLLDRNPERRLGAKRGAIEIKEHPFFDCIDWDKLVRREYRPAFKPPQITMPFREPRKERTLAEMMEQFKGFKFNEKPAGADEMKKFREKIERKFRAAPLPPPPPPSPAVKIAVNENPDWELVWDEEAKVFYFHNRSNNSKKPIVPQTFFTRSPSNRAHEVSSAADDRNLPSQIQKEDALEAVLKAGYLHLIPQLLHDYGDMDLNVKLLGFQGAPTLLEFAIEQENTKVLNLFIDEGATDTWGYALFRAVKKGHQELITILAKVADRVDLTRALGRAVNRKDMPVISTLLASGAKCDFEDSDRPPPPTGCCFLEIPENEDYMPPLVRAVKLGNMELVKLLLEHGADVNAGYHDLHGEHRFPPPSQIIDVTCGRVIQVAMELGHLDMVELFLEMGADIHLPQPAWQFHDCPMIPRAVYFRVAAGLREAVAARRSTRDSDEWVFV